MRVFDIRKDTGFHAYGSNEALLKHPWTFSIMIDGYEFIPLAHQKEGEIYAWATEAEAQANANEYSIREYDVYLVLKNVDFTEGRGPMLAHKIFKTYGQAMDYIQKQVGICGSGQYHYHTFGQNIHNGAYAIETMNGYDIRPMKFHKEE